ncbi:MAG TPA: divalent-cation tolerance protein CutA [Anaeromyxobacteraceae bacterium]|nr:divalent-cation tolerance protein CutA [Anaeromyxobacteraceae bacterium]
MAAARGRARSPARPARGRPGEALVVLVTAPSAEKAAEIARALVTERLAACGNVVPGLRSIYRWEGRVQDDAEALLLLKTTRRRFPALRARVLALHPYQVPELLALPVQAGHAAYLEWIAASIR